MKLTLFLGLILACSAGSAADFGPGYVRPSACSEKTGNKNVLQVCKVGIDQVAGNFLEVKVSTRVNPDTGKPERILYSSMETSVPGASSATLEVVKFGNVDQFNKAKMYAATRHEKAVGIVTYNKGGIRSVEITLQGIGKITATDFSTMATPWSAGK